jgi:predicted DNA-binding transcriptional regulator AlpA
LTNATRSGISEKYSVSQTAERLGIDRTTLYRWIRRRLVPALIEEVVAGVHITYWTDKDLAKINEYKNSAYWGKGIDKKTGKKAKKK